jgi:hypothetical protein
MLLLIILVLIIVLLCVAIGAVSSFSKAAGSAPGNLDRNKRQVPEELRREREEEARFEQAWDIESRYDPVIRAHVEKLSSHGDAAVAELKRVYRLTGDKEGLGEVVDQIVADIASGKFDPTAETANSEDPEWRAQSEGPPVYSRAPGRTPVSSLVSLISGIVSLILSPLALVAIISGHIALSNLSLDEADKNGRIIARIGLGLGYFVLIVYLLLIGFFLSVA